MKPQGCPQGKFLITPLHAQGVKQSVCPSVVGGSGTKIARSQVLGICACCNHNQLVDIGEKLASTCFDLLKKTLTSTTNSVFSVQHACGLSTTPTPLGCATAHA